MRVFGKASRVPTFTALFGYLLALLAVARYSRDDAGLLLFVLLVLAVVSLILAVAGEQWKSESFLALACSIGGIFILAAAAGLPVRNADHTDFRLLLIVVPAMTWVVSLIRRETGRPLVGKRPNRQVDWISIRASGVMLLSCALVFTLGELAIGGRVTWPSIIEVASMGAALFVFGLIAPLAVDQFAPRYGTGKAV